MKVEELEVEERMLVLWSSAMLVLLYDVLEKDKGFLMRHSTLTEKNTI